ncbi:MAG: hypothetical protein JXB14_04925 [Candidatus Altiarchaeota archaeon]|nr:hypothetical protein [Candidatus Altiarchaeota archaeon]
MGLKIAWGVTGGGNLLKESVDAFRKAKKELDPKITILLSRAGEEVTMIYGLRDGLKEVSPGGYYEEIFTEAEQGASAYKTGRFYLRRYDALFVSPTTTNTIAKIANGIADTLVTNAVALAMKADLPVYVLPTDNEPGRQGAFPPPLTKGLERMGYKTRQIDKENLRLLRKYGVCIMNDPAEIYATVRRMSKK